VETKLTALETKLADATKEVDALKATLDERDQQLATANARIAELEKAPAAEHTSGPTETPVTDDASKKFTGDPATQKAIADYNRMQALKKS
jgi:multidrug resistance efflux pump